MCILYSTRMFICSMNRRRYFDSSPLFRFVARRIFRPIGNKLYTLLGKEKYTYNYCKTNIPGKNTKTEGCIQESTVIVYIIIAKNY